MRPEILEMIEQEPDGTKKEILIKLNSLNYDAMMFMSMPISKEFKGHQNTGVRYRALQRQDCWKEARLLIKRYYTINSVCKCAHCGNPIGQRFTLHHEMYAKHFNELFCPLFVEIIHSGCHAKHHGVKK